MLAFVLGGCGSSSDTTSSTGGAQAQHEPQAGASAAPQLVQRSATAKGREAGGPQSAAAACGQARGGVPTLTIESDVPVPRCLVVQPHQRLRVLNETQAPGAPGGPIRISLAGFHASVPLHGSVILDARLGSYLMPGWHYLNVSGGPGPAALHLQG